MVEAIKFDSELHYCYCPMCERMIYWGGEEAIKYCERCGTKIHMRIATQKEREYANFQLELDSFFDD